MVASVSGPLRLVTDEPAVLVQVMVRAPRPRPHAGGMVVDFTALASVEGGVVSFQCLPGPAVLAVVHAGVPQVTVPLVVPDAPSATLEECIRAAKLADTATRSELEGLAARAVAAVSQAEQAASAARESAGAVEADRREVSADREAIDGYRQEVTAARGETLAARDAASAAAETATLKSDEARTHALECYLWAEGEARLAEAAAASAKADADRATSEADRSKTEADRAAQAAADSSVKAVADKVDELLAGAPEAYDTLLEIAEELERGASAEAALVKEISGKAPVGHTHTAQDVGAAPASHTHQARDVWDASGETVQSVLDSHELKGREIDGLKSAKLDKSEVSQDNTGGTVVRRQDDGHIISADYSSPQKVLDTLNSQPTSLASLWAAQQIATDAVAKHTPKVTAVTELPDVQDPDTIYLVLEG